MSPPTEFQNGPDTVLERSCPFVVVQANPSISQAEIEEAYQWHDLFSKGYLTAHEMADLTSTDFPSTTGELFRVETENLQRIKQLIDQHLTDDEFRRHLAEIRALLPQPFRDMESMSSAWINPVDHTVDALAKLDTSGLKRPSLELSLSSMMSVRFTIQTIGNIQTALPILPKTI